MTRLNETQLAPATPALQNEKEVRTMKNALRKSLMAAIALTVVISAASVATADNGSFGADSPWTYTGTVQGVDHVYPYTFPDAEQRAYQALTAWSQQNPQCHILSHTKRCDWVMVNGQQRARCTITFVYEVFPW